MRMFLARAQLVLAVAPDKDDDERAQTESEGRAKNNTDLRRVGVRPGSEMEVLRL